MKPDSLNDLKTEKSKESTTENINLPQDIKKWLSENAHSIIFNFAKIASLVAVANLALNMFSSPLALAFSEHDVATNIEEAQHEGTYTQEILQVNKKLREASVEINLGKECTGTILEKIGENYTAILATHCLKNDDNEMIIEPGDDVMIGQSVDGSQAVKTWEGFELTNYISVPDTDISFVAFHGYPNTKIPFSPYGNNLKVFDQLAHKSLTGFGYPHVAEGYPYPINDLSTGGSTYDPSGELIIPVEDYPLAPGGSGTGFISGEGNIIGIGSGVRYDFIDSDNEDKKIVMSPVTPAVISAYDQFVQRIRTK